MVRQAVNNILLTIGGFVWQGKLGDGASGAVYRAQDLSLGRRVAVKVLHSSFFHSDSAQARFRQEARSMAEVAAHPGIVSIHRVSQHPETPYLVMDYVEGGSLRTKLKSKDSSLTPIAQVCTLMSQIADTVGFMHEKGVIHRDLKPGNILLTKDNEPRVSDFGLAHQDHPGTRLTQTGDGAAGTPMYMAPEQFDGLARAEAPADVYSLGVILYEMFTGRVPFQLEEQETWTEFRNKIENQSPPSLRRIRPDVPLDLESITLKCLHPDPKDRYENAGELASDLARFLEGRPVSARPIGMTVRLGKWIARNRVPVSVGSVLLLLTISTLSFWKRSNDAEKQAHDSNAKVVEVLSKADHEFVELQLVHIGQNLQLTTEEKKALQEISMIPPEDERRRLLILNKVLSKDELAEGAQRRAHKLMRALVGLDNARRSRFLKLLRAKAKEDTASDTIRATASSLALALEDNDPQLLERASTVLLVQLRDPRNRSLVNDYQKILRRMTPTQAKSKLRDLVEAMCRAQDPISLQKLALCAQTAREQMRKSDLAPRTDLADRLRLRIVELLLRDGQQRRHVDPRIVYLVQELQPLLEHNPKLRHGKTADALASRMETIVSDPTLPLTSRVFLGRLLDFIPLQRAEKLADSLMEQMIPVLAQGAAPQGIGIRQRVDVDQVIQHLRATAVMNTAKRYVQTITQPRIAALNQNGDLVTFVSRAFADRLGKDAENFLRFLLDELNKTPATTQGLSSRLVLAKCLQGIYSSSQTTRESLTTEAFETVCAFAAKCEGHQHRVFARSIQALVNKLPARITMPVLQNLMKTMEQRAQSMLDKWNQTRKESGIRRLRIPGKTSSELLQMAQALDALKGTVPASSRERVARPIASLAIQGINSPLVASAEGGTLMMVAPFTGSSDALLLLKEMLAEIHVPQLTGFNRSTYVAPFEALVQRVGERELRKQHNQLLDLISKAAISEPHRIEYRNLLAKTVQPPEGLTQDLLKLLAQKQLDAQSLAVQTKAWSEGLAKVPAQKAQTLALRVLRVLRDELRNIQNKPGNVRNIQNKPGNVRTLAPIIQAAVPYVSKTESRLLEDLARELLAHVDRGKGAFKVVRIGATEKAFLTVASTMKKIKPDRLQDEIFQLTVALTRSLNSALFQNPHQLQQALDTLKSTYVPLLTDQDLLKLLNSPFTPAEMIAHVLDHINQRWKTSFGTMWEMARWIEKNRKDLDLAGR